MTSSTVIRSMFQWLAACWLLMPLLATAQQTPEFNGATSTWHDGFVRYDFIMDDSTLTVTPFKAPEGERFGIGEPPKGKHRCIVVAPATPAPGHPWSWQGCYWDHQPQTEVALLHRGFYICYISAGAGLPPGKHWDAWYQYLTAHGLSSKPCFIGMSRGGQFEYTWATEHPDKVSCIYADNPAVTNEALMKLGDLARNNVPLIHVCGSFDPLFQIATEPIERIYQSFGGRISIMIKEGFGHHPHSLRNPKPLADFIEQSVKETIAPTPDFVPAGFTRSYYYGNADTYRYYPDEGAYITTRGPWFSSCFAKYIFQLQGVESFVTVLAPQQPAAGNPWIFRAGYVKQNAVVDQALLEKGYYIVVGAVPYNEDGPVLAQWNVIYQHFTSHGFAARPVIQGEGGAAGEAIAWAVSNPEKVSCIYAENPVFTSKVMITTPLLNDLSPLAKAHVPVLLVSGAADPDYTTQTLAAQKAYRALGGHISVITEKNEGHYLQQHDVPAAVGFVLANSK